MTRIKNNPIMTDASGMLGNVVVYRQFRGQTLMCNRPEKRRDITPHQRRMKSRFLEAVVFAKKQIADPVTKALYQAESSKLKTQSRNLKLFVDGGKFPVVRFFL